LERLRRWRRREPVKAAVIAVLAVAVPVLTGTAGYLWARRDEIRAGQAQLLKKHVQEDGEQGFLSYTLGRPGLGRRRVEAGLALDAGCAEAQVGALFAVLRGSGADAALARLDAGSGVGMAPAFAALVRCMLMYTLGRREEGEALNARLAVPHTEMELFLHAML